jgi:hypothetical protein
MSEPLEVLRAIWRSQGQTGPGQTGPGQTGAVLGSETKSCKRMDDAGVGFEDFADGATDLAAAWRARLEREGKLVQSGEGSVRDLILGPGVSVIGD